MGVLFLQRSGKSPEMKSIKILVSNVSLLSCYFNGIVKRTVTVCQNENHYYKIMKNKSLKKIVYEYILGCSRILSVCFVYCT
jgi:hypothetical protein